MPDVSKIPADAPPLVPAAHLQRWFGVCKGTVWHWVDTGRIPQPIDLGPRHKMFDVAAIRAALAGLKPSRGGPVPAA